MHPVGFDQRSLPLAEEGRVWQESSQNSKALSFCFVDVLRIHVGDFCLVGFFLGCKVVILG